jgi:hypothetical protein
MAYKANEACRQRTGRAVMVCGVLEEGWSVAAVASAFRAFRQHPTHTSVKYIR